eukprot:SAG22_NODE_6640_length_828_cov_1.275720_1_plen_83_part_01
MSSYSLEERQDLLDRGGGLRKLRNSRIQHVRGATTKRRVLERVLREHHYDAVLVFSNVKRHERDTMTADARAVVSSMLIEEIL